MPLEKRHDITSASTDEELLILNAEGTTLHHLNVTASFVWNEWDGHKSVPDIADRLAARFDVSLETARTDVERLVQQFKDLGLLLETTSLLPEM